MDSSEYLVIGVLVVFVLYGLGNFIAAPLLTRRFYRELGFVDQGIDQGKSWLESPAQSELLEPLATSRLYRGQFKGYTVEQCKAYPKSRRRFTLSKVRRKHNQTRWSVTRLKCEQALPEFCMSPTSDISTALRMLEDPGIDLSDDDAFVGRYHLRCEDPYPVKQLIFGDLREFLLQREMISIECIDDTVIIKRMWPVEKLKSRLLDELNRCVAIAEELPRCQPSNIKSSL